MSHQIQFHQSWQASSHPYPGSMACVLANMMNEQAGNMPAVDVCVSTLVFLIR